MRLYEYISRYENLKCPSTFFPQANQNEIDKKISAAEKFKLDIEYGKSTDFPYYTLTDYWYIYKTDLADVVLELQEDELPPAFRTLINKIATELKAISVPFNYKKLATGSACLFADESVLDFSDSPVQPR